MARTLASIALLLAGCPAPPLSPTVEISNVRDAEVDTIPTVRDAEAEATSTNTDDEVPSDSGVAEWIAVDTPAPVVLSDTIQRPTVACDGINDDGDEFIDENSQSVDGVPLGWHCAVPWNTCEGVVLCVDGQAECVVAELPVDDVYNGEDDDCDGRIDEDAPSIGGPCSVSDTSERCSSGAWVCSGGEPICKPLASITEEICNGVDDDCDGIIDEGVTNRCGSCGPAPAEIMNGADDDCDGLVDEGRLDGPCRGDRDCVGDMYCADGRCAADCPDECDTCEECARNWIAEDGQPVIEPDGCASACATCLSGCSHVGGVCVDRVCRRSPIEHKCAEGDTMLATHVPMFDGGQLEPREVVVCEPSP